MGRSIYALDAHSTSVLPPPVEVNILVVSARAEQSARDLLPPSPVAGEQVAVPTA